jgi:molybdopterin converting factor small subunit
MRVRVVISGRHYDTAAVLPKELELPHDCPLDAALEVLRGRLPADFQLPESCLVAVSGRHLGTLREHQAWTLRDGDELLLLAPVAGG